MMHSQPFQAQQHIISSCFCIYKVYSHLSFYILYLKVRTSQFLNKEFKGIQFLRIFFIDRNY